MVLNSITGRKRRFSNERSSLFGFTKCEIIAEPSEKKSRHSLGVLMPKKRNSFDMMPDIAKRMPRIDPRWLSLWCIIYWVLQFWRRIRISKTFTCICGPQYHRSRDMIEIDITYECNLHCLNCNRAVRQARESLHISMAQISRFVDESIEKRKKWQRIRVLGGEPTLHPEFRKIIEELLRYIAVAHSMYRGSRVEWFRGTFKTRTSATSSHCHARRIVQDESCSTTFRSVQSGSGR